VVNTYEAWKTTQAELVARQVLKEAAGDPELQEMAALEVEELAAARAARDALEGAITSRSE